VVDRVRPDLLRRADATVAGVLLNQVRQHPTQRNAALTIPRGMRQAERAGSALALSRGGPARTLGRYCLSLADGEYWRSGGSVLTAGDR
jgi:hypothetical protein